MWKKISFIWFTLALIALATVCAFPVEAQGFCAVIGVNMDLSSVVGGGALCAMAMPEVEFQRKVLDGVESISRRQDEFDAHVRGMKEWKAEQEKIKRALNDQHAGTDRVMKHIARIEELVRNEKRAAFGDPVRRIQDNEEMRTRLNVAIRLACDHKGDMHRLCEPMLKELHVDNYAELYRQKALGEDSAPGSTIIDDSLAREIYDTLSMYGVWNTFAVRRLTTKQTKLPVKTARTVTNVILTEAGTIADDTNKAGTSVTLEVELLGCLLNVSMQLIQDAEVDLTQDVLMDFAESYAERLDHLALTAAGAANGTDGGMTGVFEGGTLVAAAATEDTVEELDLEDFSACLLAVDPVVLSRQARWWLHPFVLVRALTIKDSNGRPIFQNALEAPLGVVGSILGFPITLAHKAPSSNTANTKIATFGDPNGMVVGVRTDFAFEASDHHRWSTFERSFRGTGRAGTKIRRSQAFANLRLTT